MDARTPQQRFDAAIEAGEYDEAVTWSRVMPEFTLASHLRLTILSAKRDPGQFGDLAREWLARALSEGLIASSEIHSVTCELDAIREGTADGSALLNRVRLDESAWPKG